MPVPTPVSAYSNLCCPHSDGQVSVSRQRIFVYQSSCRQYPEETGQTCFEQHPDRQASETADSLISKHPDGVSTADRIETKQIRRQTLDSIFQKSGQNPDSCQNRDRQDPDGETSDRKSGKNLDSRQTPDTIFQKIQKKMRHGQDTNSAVFRHLVTRIFCVIWYKFFFYS